MAPLRNLRNSFLLALESNIIDDEEFCAFLMHPNVLKEPHSPSFEELASHQQHGCLLAWD